LTVQAYHAMLDSAPAYYFAYTPWLMANGAGGHWDAAWKKPPGTRSMALPCRWSMPSKRPPPL
jgi:hypothetical protein